MKKAISTIRTFALLLVFTIGLIVPAQSQEQWVVYEGGDGAGAGNHIVFVTGDDEYRSEESMPQMAKMLSEHHGFKCTVLFAIDPETGAIKPDYQKNIPGLKALQTADLMVIFTRFRDLPDDQMKFIVEYLETNKPIIGIRTATHAFNFQEHTTYAEYSFRSEEWEGGFGRQVLGETWINHYGKHQQESTRGLIVKGFGNEMLANGCSDIWGPSDVYGLTTLHGDCAPIVMGQVLTGMQPDDPPKPDTPIVPVAWTKIYKHEDTGNVSKVFTSTMGHSGDFKNEDFRRLMVNAVYWSLEMKVPEMANVDIVGTYDPNPIGFGKYKEGILPSDHALN